MLTETIPHIPQQIESLCHYLFNKEAGEIFGHEKKSNDAKSKFVEDSLALLMRVNVHLLSKKDSFFLIDPLSYNSQCHLHSLRAAKIKNSYSTLTETQKMSRNENNRFLHLAFFLSQPLILDKSLFVKTVASALKEMGEKKPTAELHNFLTDKSRQLEKAARTALNAQFEKSIKVALQEAAENQPDSLNKELVKLANTELFAPATRSNTKEKIYTFPKFAGVAYLNAQLKNLKIPVVLKVKILSDLGCAGSYIIPERKVIKDGSSQLPALVIEAIATDGSISLLQSRKGSVKCPHSAYRDIRPAYVHDTALNCFFCKKVDGDLSPQLEEAKKAMEYRESMLYQQGADYVIQQQPMLKDRFQDSEKYPELVSLFNKATQKLEDLGIKKTSALSISHVYCDSYKNSLEPQMQLDTAPETYLQLRGVL